jgi:hypothetical protein
MDHVRKAGGNAGSLDSPPGESKFIDDHVAGFVDDHAAVPTSQTELPIVEIANCNSDRQAGPKQLWGVWRRPQVLLHSTGYQQVDGSSGTSGGLCGQLKHQYKLETIGWRSCC